ncbi:hypothetical protein SAMN04488057_104346 [Cyclobacterium lianum]|uniref:Uncharacterized protein n=1 Tax=Cyclobacterium lianum TaxID=388280 RepID=A0A1M7MKE9_9BACT|nr:hypothetical protein [Cyclobacterium lianum]SHM91325.1 hypothetical protein SAMN04488057_104346 [Cyclobacterium lianum]
MNKFPKENIFKVPEDYFESLPDIILDKRKQRIKNYYISGIAAAAVLLVGFLILAINFSSMEETDLQAEINNDVEYYIATGIWDDEEILLLAEHPNDLLDLIAEEEWSRQEWDEEEFYDNEMWY